MNRKPLILIWHIILIGVGIVCLCFETFTFFIETLNKPYYEQAPKLTGDLFYHFLTLLICLWFIIYNVIKIAGLLKGLSANTGDE